MTPKEMLPHVGTRGSASLRDYNEQRFTTPDLRVGGFETASLLQGSSVIYRLRMALAAFQ